MSLLNPDEAETVMLGYPCGYCEAIVGEWCRTRAGWLVANLHAARFWAATADGKLPLAGES